MQLSWSSSNVVLSPPFPSLGPHHMDMINDVNFLANMVWQLLAMSTCTPAFWAIAMEYMLHHCNSHFHNNTCCTVARMEWPITVHDCIDMQCLSDAATLSCDTNQPVHFWVFSFKNHGLVLMDALADSSSMLMRSATSERGRETFFSTNSKMTG